MKINDIKKELLQNSYFISANSDNFNLIIDEIKDIFNDMDFKNNQDVVIEKVNEFGAERAREISSFANRSAINGKKITIIYFDFITIEALELAAEYYNALYDFNLARRNKSDTFEADNESKEEAAQRLLFERSTVNKDAPILASQEIINPAAETVNINEIAPGITPQRSGGKKPKCFFALFKSHIGVSLMGFPPESEMVYNFLWRCCMKRRFA